MPQTCTACRHAERASIDRLLVEGAPLRNVAERFGLSTTAVHRHRAHIPVALAKAAEAQAVADAGTLLGQVERLRDRAVALLDSAEGANDYRAAAGLLREVRGAIELLARLAVHFPERQEEWAEQALASLITRERAEAWAWHWFSMRAHHDVCGTLREEWERFSELHPAPRDFDAVAVWDAMLERGSVDWVRRALRIVQLATREGGDLPPAPVARLIQEWEAAQVLPAPPAGDLEDRSVGTASGLEDRSTTLAAEAPRWTPPETEPKGEPAFDPANVAECETLRKQLGRNGVWRNDF